MIIITLIILIIIENDINTIYIYFYYKDIVIWDDFIPI